MTDANERALILTSEQAQSVWSWGKTQHRVPGARNPFGRPGDVLWVRESWSEDHTTVYPCPPRWYRGEFTEYDDPAGDWTAHDCTYRHPQRNQGDCFGCAIESTGKPFQWKSPVTMRREQTRSVLDVQRVWQHPLHEMSDEDFRNEGYSRFWDPRALPKLEAREWFKQVWVSKHGVESWESNPLVWAVQFRRKSVSW